MPSLLVWSFLWLVRIGVSIMDYDNPCLHREDSFLKKNSSTLEVVHCKDEWHIVVIFDLHNHFIPADMHMYIYIHNYQAFIVVDCCWSHHCVSRVLDYQCLVQTLFGWFWKPKEYSPTCIYLYIYTRKKKNIYIYIYILVENCYIRYTIWYPHQICWSLRPERNLVKGDDHPKLGWTDGKRSALLKKWVKLWKRIVIYVPFQECK